MMEPEEFNRLTNELLWGLPITLVTTRLLLALRKVVESGGEDAAKALRDYCAYRREIDESAGWEEFKP